MTLENLEKVFSGITEPFTPVPLMAGKGITAHAVLVKGAFYWHRHDSADELFVVRSGKLTIHYKDREVTLGPDEFHVVPRGAVHKTSSREGAEVLFVGPDDWIKV